MSDQGRKPLDLTRNRVEQLLAAYGARSESWPAEEREQVRSLLAACPELRLAQQEQSVLDNLLDDAPQHEPSRRLRDVILAGAPRPILTWAERANRWASGLWPFGHSWQPVATLAAATVLGVVMGLVGEGSDVDSDTLDLAGVMIEDLGDLGDLP